MACHSCQKCKAIRDFGGASFFSLLLRRILPKKGRERYVSAVFYLVGVNLETSKKSHRDL
jgi:hypothetical protein